MFALICIPWTYSLAALQWREETSGFWSALLLWNIPLPPTCILLPWSWLIIHIIVLVVRSTRWNWWNPNHLYQMILGVSGDALAAYECQRWSYWMGREARGGDRRESWGIWETTFAIFSDSKWTVTVNVCSINEYGRALHNGLLQI